MKIYFVIAGLVIFGVICFLFGYKWDAGKLKTYEAGLASCVSDNVQSRATVSTLQKLITNSNTLCMKRLSEKDVIIANDKKLLSLEVKSETTGSLSDDAMLSALNGVWAESSYKGGYCSPANSLSSGGTATVPSTLLYCFPTKQDAVNFIRNIVLLDADRKDCRDIVSSLTQTK